MSFHGIDHVDLRVSALIAVEAFYDGVMARLGLTRKTYATVAFGGASWDGGDTETYNTVEYHEENVSGRPALFFGVIEEDGAQPSRSRVAFRVSEDSLDEWERVLPQLGAREIERSDEETYPAIFFTDPLGTRLEICARRPRA